MAHANEITILIPDPDEMMFVTGTNEANIDRIEREFGVKVISRGAELRISGEPAAVSRVSDLVTAMRGLSARDENLRKPALERLIGDAKEAPVTAPEEMREHVATTTSGKRIRPQSENQRRYIEAMKRDDLVFAIGVAGTGKSYLAVAMGVQALRDRKVSRLILTRPAVEAGERLGFLPGDIREKVDPYLRPLYDALYELMPPERSARAMERGEIEVAPLAYMRGRTLNEAFIILDEAQNTTPAQMKMFLTRLGYGSQAVVTGDVTQIDLVAGQPSGLLVAREVLGGVEGIAFVEFDERDVVRHELVTRIVRAYDKHSRGSGSAGPSEPLTSGAGGGPKATPTDQEKHSKGPTA
jgi:phosphate starvation-inducible PhoH-like protein